MTAEVQRALVLSKLARLLGPHDAEKVLDETLVGLGLHRIETAGHRLQVGQAFVARGGALATIGHAICSQAGIHSRPDNKGEAHLNAGLSYAAAIVRGSDGAIVAVDDQNVIRTWNPGAEALYGHSAAESVGRDISMVATEEGSAELADLLEHVRRDNYVDHVEVVHRTKSGDQITVSLTISPMRNAERRIIGAALVGRDITARRKAELAIRNSESRKAAMLNAALDAIITMDHEGKIVEYNRAAETTFGYTMAEAKGKKLAGLIIPKRMRRAHEQGLSEYTKTGRQAVVGRRLELTALHKDGHEFPVEVSIVALEGTDPPLFTGFLRDITERKEAAQADKFRMAKEAAEEANRELDSFSYSVSHDLRAPLRAIDGFSKILLKDYSGGLDEQGTRHLERIRSGAQRMSMLIDDLLNLSRISRADLERRHFDLSALARRVADDLREREPHRNVRVSIADGLHENADERLVRVLLENLFANAWKFTAKVENPQIWFGIETENHAPPYFIRDNGAGFDMAYAKNLFGAFQRLHKSSDFDGTGVGLATVSRIVSRHGGRIWADAKVNEGATFFFTLGGLT